MTSMLLTVLIVLNATLTLAAVILCTFIFRLVRRPAVDVAQIGASLAFRLIDIYDDEADVLTERNVKKHARERYVELCASTGLPLELAGQVEAAAWETAAAYVGQPSGVMYE